MNLQEIKEARHLQVHFELANEIKEDSRFTIVKVWIAHTGKNLNKSYFSKEMLQQMIPSLPYIPIVGFIQSDSSNKEDFAGHEERIVVSNNGVEVEYLGRMYGFIPVDCNPRFELKNVGGVDREYLVADGVIVNKFAKAKEILDRDIEKGQSMELELESLDGYYEKENDQFVITNARFEALCILGDSKIPAMIGGAIEKIQFTSIKFELKELIEELKQEYENKKGGGILDIAKFEELLKNYAYISNEFAEDLKVKLGTFETEDSLIEVLNNENNTQFALTVGAQIDLLDKAVTSLETYVDRWGDVRSRYYFKDAKLDEMQVFCVDRKDYQDCGFTFAKVGEEFVIDKSTQFKVAWQPIALGEGQSAKFEVAQEIKVVYDYTVEKFEGEIESIKAEYEVKLEEQKTEFESKFSAQEVELAELKAYKQSIETEAKKEYVNNVENLDVNEKEDLIATIENYSIDELADEVAKIVGKKSIKFSTKETLIVDTISTAKTRTDESKKAYDYLFETDK